MNRNIINSYKYMKHKIVCRMSIMKTINPSSPRGKLTVIPTPIGNMNDLSPNILKALFSADLIGCQDRRIAGKLYNLIKNKNILQQMNQTFGSIGLNSLIQLHPQLNINQQQKRHQYYNYSNMSDKERRKFLRSFSQAQQNQFKLDYLKYRAEKILSKENTLGMKRQYDKWDELYGIETSDLKHIETQIYNCKKTKGRGVLIPLNTYSQTKMFDLVSMLLESKQVALVSDAGMPCISDPGWKLINNIRNKMPEVIIQIIGGPSSVQIMTQQASVSSKNGELSGRFEGFSNLATGNYEQNNQQLKNVKLNQFSINFINANKLKKRLIQLEQMLGNNNHKIILANQLTKRYQRRYCGKIGELINLMDQEQKGKKEDMKLKGQIAFLTYPITDKDQIKQKDQQNLTDTVDLETNHDDQNSELANLTNATISIEQLAQSLQRHGVSSLKERSNILSSVFGIKQNEAKKYVYNKIGKQK